jgi:hypothetical protein
MSMEDTNCDTASGLPDASKLEDANIVDWDGTKDPTNPHNWPSRKRWAHVILVAILALVT